MGWACLQLRAQSGRAEMGCRKPGPDVRMKCSIGTLAGMRQLSVAT